MCVAAVVRLHFDQRLLTGTNDLDREKRAANCIPLNMNLVHITGAETDENRPLIGFSFPWREILEVIDRESIGSTDNLQSRPRIWLRSFGGWRTAFKQRVIRIGIRAGL